MSLSWRAGISYYDTCKARSQLALREPRPVEQAIADAYAWFQTKS